MFIVIDFDLHSENNGFFTPTTKVARYKNRFAAEKKIYCCILALPPMHNYVTAQATDVVVVRVFDHPFIRNVD